MGVLSLRGCQALALGALLLGCAHTPPPPPPDAPVWPRPPQAAVVRWAGTFPDERFSPAGPSPLRKVWNAIMGLEPEKAATGLLLRPFGLAALERGFAVADPDAPAVLRVDWRGGKFETVTCAAFPWQTPIALAASPAGVLFVADGAAGVVVRVDEEGRCSRIGEGLLQRPSGLAFADGRLYVVDPPRHQVNVFLEDGKAQFHFGLEAGAHGLNFPTAIALAADGTVLVVDALNFRVVRFSLDGKYVGEFGQSGDGEGAFGRPKGIAVDSGGRLYITDAQHDVTLIFTATGTFLLAVGGSGAGPGSLALPAGVATRDGYLYVANSYNRRIEIFILAGQDTP